MMKETTVPKHALATRDAIKFARFSYKSLVLHKGEAQLDMLCERLVKKAQYALRMDGLTPRQLDEVRRALLNGPAAYGASIYPKVKEAKKELAWDAAMIGAPTCFVAVATASTTPVLAALAFTMGRAFLSSLVPTNGIPACATVLCEAIEGARELRDKMWRAMLSGIDAGAQHEA